MRRLPSWMRSNLRTDGAYAGVHELVADLGLHTVCQSAHCPNLSECWNRGTATFMILGDMCTRHCLFCAVSSGRPAWPDVTEPARVAAAVSQLKLRYVVLTSVTRDDLEDGGAGFFAQTVRAIRKEAPGVAIEVLTPDFMGSEASLNLVLDSGPDVLGHNLETVKRLQPLIRSGASYERSLAVLKRAAASGRARIVKSGLMAGMGETREELFEAMTDLHRCGCRALTIGQYLAPTAHHHPVARFVPPEEFDGYAAQARERGFEHVMAGPLVRSSYRAEELASSGRGG